MAGMRASRILLLLFFVLLTNDSGNRSLSAQQAPRQPSSTQISIVSPPDGTVVHPGDILHIDVSVASDKPIRLVTIISPLGTGDGMRESPPWSFTFTIPKDTSVGGGAPLLGKHPLYADVALEGQQADAEPGAAIMIDVERPDMPIKLWTEHSGIFPEAFGEKERIDVVGVFSDGAQLELNESCCLTFTSSNEKVVAVDRDGTVTAVAPGRAFVTAVYSRGDQQVRHPIPVDFPPPVMNVEPRSLDFGEQQVGTSTAPLRVTLTNNMHGPMGILKPAIHGEFTETNDCDALSPLREEGGTCTVFVVFTPKSKGLRSGELEVWNSYSGIPSSIPLSGTGR
ncbi:MAG TPA: choice-of-anchor D domain-containing protein [Candidatus Sulfotelmatobacter sp.]|nr:choice-of-anchor D domain-containing protein [Candidatus Sulfotelmatobacter sp.]